MAMMVEGASSSYNGPFPRWYGGVFANPKFIVQLHNFGDASQLAYGAVSYLRVTIDKGQHLVSFLSSRSKQQPYLD